MKICLFSLAFSLAAAFLPYAAVAQQIAPRDTVFPFNIALVSPDSTSFTNTKKLLKKTEGPTVFAFWLTTCPPCHQELAAYKQHYAEWQKQAKFRLIAVSVDFPDRFHQLTQQAKEKQLPFEVWWDRDRAFRDVLPGELNGLPQVFIFDKNGKLAWHHKRYRPGDEAEVFAKIMELQ